MSYGPVDLAGGVAPPDDWSLMDWVAEGWIDRRDFFDFMAASFDGDDKERRRKVVAAISAKIALRSNRLRRPGAVETVGGVSAADAINGLDSVFEVERVSDVYLSRHLARRIADAGVRLVRDEGHFYAFNRTEWQEVDDDTLRLAVHKYDAAATVTGNSSVSLSSGKISGIMREFAAIIGRPGFFSSPTVGLNASNGVVTLDAKGGMAMRPHHPDDRFRFTVSAPVDLPVNGQPEEWSMLHRLLRGAFLGDEDADAKVDLVGEILGAAAFGQATRLPQPKAFVFLGETASNGKSTIARLLSILLPASAVCSIPLSAFDDEKRIVGLAGKAANIADEVSASGLSGESVKAAITGDPMTGRDVYTSAITFTPRAVHVFTTNQLPTFTGGLDRGLQRRLVVLRFNRTIPTGEIVPDILERIAREELGQLLEFAIAGAQRLVRNRGYTIPISSEDALGQWLRLDPIEEWVSQRVHKVDDRPSGGWLRTSELYADFSQWAEGEGHIKRMLPTRKTFSMRLARVPGIQKSETGSGTSWVGIKLKGTVEVLDQW